MSKATLTRPPAAHRVRANAWRDPEPPDPLDVFTSLPVGEDGEHYDLELSPWVRLIFEWWLDPEVDWIYLIQGSQTSKTTTMMGLALYAAKHQPGPAMWVMNVEDEADKFVVQRLKPFLEAADTTTRTKFKRDWRKLDLRIFGRMLLHVAWATSGRRLRSWPCRYLFGDEVGIWPASLTNVGDPLEYVKKRTRRYRTLGRKGVFATTPSDESHPSWVAATLAQFYRWWVHCPECDAAQALTFDRVRFDHCRRKDGTWDKLRVRSTTFYECPECSARIVDSQKAGMIAGGAGVCVEPGTGKPQTPEPGNRSRTLQIPAAYSLFTPWGELAASFLEAKEKGPEQLRIWVTDEAAEPWREPTDSPGRDTLRACIDADRAVGAVPDEAPVVALATGIDVQHRECYWTTWAFALAQRSYLLDWGIVPVTLESGLSMLDEIIARDYDGWQVEQTFIDAADGAMTQTVYDWTARFGPNVAPCRGRTTGRNSRLVYPMVLDPAKSKARVAKGTILYHVLTAHWRAALHDRIRVARGEASELRLPGAVSDEVLDHLLAWERVRITKSGQVIVDWRQRRLADHFLDASIYAHAAAWFPLQVQNRKAGEAEVITDWFKRQREKRGK